MQNAKCKMQNEKIKNGGYRNPQTPLHIFVFIPKEIKKGKARDGERDKGKLLKLRQSLHKLVKISKQS
jgi:hypothetical protein